MTFLFLVTVYNVNKNLSEAEIRAINAVLAKDQRVELIPTKDGVRVIRIRREEVKASAEN